MTIAEPLTLKSLTGTPAELQAVGRVLDGAPGYATAVHGEPFPPDTARILFEELPPGFEDRTAKTVLGIYRGSVMIGVADVIRGYPTPETLMLGLLVLHEGSQRQGAGSEAVRLLASLARDWGCGTVRIGVVATNLPAFGFWDAMGFSRTGEVKPWRDGPVVSEVVTMEKHV